MQDIDDDCCEYLYDEREDRNFVDVSVDVQVDRELEYLYLDVVYNAKLQPARDIIAEFAGNEITTFEPPRYFVEHRRGHSDGTTQHRTKQEQCFSCGGSGFHRRCYCYSCGGSGTVHKA